MAPPLIDAAARSRWSAALVLLVAVTVSRGADARRRPLFEPTDLEMEDPGTLEVDLQFGALRGEAPWRVTVPDFEVDVGLSEDVELDIDGAYAIEGPDDGTFSFDHAAPDDVWVAAKLGIYDDVDDGSKATWAVGAQLGPKLPAAREAHGIGYEGLLLIGRHWGDESHVVLNVGGLVDPGGAISSQRPAGIEGGVDVSVALRGTQFSVSGELAGVRFFSNDPHQLHATAGLTWATTSTLDISLVGLVGFLRGGDRAGVLVGVSPKMALWH